MIRLAITYYDYCMVPERCLVKSGISDVEVCADNKIYDGNVYFFEAEPKQNGCYRLTRMVR